MTMVIENNQKPKILMDGTGWGGVEVVGVRFGWGRGVCMLYITLYYWS